MSEDRKISLRISKDLDAAFDAIRIEMEGVGIDHERSEMRRHLLKRVLAERLPTVSSEIPSGEVWFRDILAELSASGRVVFQDGFVIGDEEIDATIEALPGAFDTLTTPTVVLPSRQERIAEGILIFACTSPDDAEAAVGDLIEKVQKVALRQPKFVCFLYFSWELTLLVVVKFRKRLMDSTIGPLLDRWFKRSAS